MSSAKSFLNKNRAKREKKLEKESSLYTNYAHENLKEIRALLKARCPMDYAKIDTEICNFLAAAKSENATKLEFPPMNGALLSAVLYGLALHIGNTDKAMKLTEQNWIMRYQSTAQDSAFSANESADHHSNNPLQREEPGQTS